jgi:anti-sigma-K factor RskA
LIGGYVLDGLEPAEQDAVRRHLATCEVCAREHAELATLPALLEMADSADAVPERPPARLEEAVLDRFARESRGLAPAITPRRSAWRARLRGTRRPMLAIAALAIVFVIGTAVLAVGLMDEDGDNGTIYRSHLAGAAIVPGATADARLYVESTGTSVRLNVKGLQSRQGKVYNYELWCVRDDGWRISAGTFRVDKTGHADVQLTTAARPNEYDTLSVVARPASDKPDAQGTRVLQGRIES